MEKEKGRSMIKNGVIVNCKYVNIRKTPTKKGNIVATIPFDTIVRVEIDASTKTFYKVFYEDKEGYCIKTCVSIFE